MVDAPFVATPTPDAIAENQLDSLTLTIDRLHLVPRYVGREALSPGQRNLRTPHDAQPRE
jgi:hypothetical protein